MKRNDRPAPVVPVLTVEARLKRALRRHLRELGFKHTDDGLAPPEDSKDAFRRLHRVQLRDRLGDERLFIAKHWPLVRDHFAKGSEVDASRVRPRLEVIHGDTPAVEPLSDRRDDVERASPAGLRPSPAFPRLGQQQRQADGSDRACRSGLQPFGARPVQVRSPRNPVNSTGSERMDLASR